MGIGCLCGLVVYVDQSCVSTGGVSVDRSHLGTDQTCGLVVCGDWLCAWTARMCALLVIGTGCT